jgi:hypothetical protein
MTCYAAVAQIVCCPAAGMDGGDRPWLKSFVHMPAAWDPPFLTRKRPFNYVYELLIYNAVLLSVSTYAADVTAQHELRLNTCSTSADHERRQAPRHSTC